MMAEKNEMRDDELESALKNFRLSVHAWSEAEFSRPRTAKAPTPKTVWRTAAGWAMGCVLVLGVASGGVYEHERQVELRQQEQARQARMAEQQAEEQKQAAASAALDEDALLRHVDSDVAREVPAAMDPLAGLVDDETSKKQ
jgi:cytochrome c-type biogenesis protein CcmH/NrfG